MAPGRAGVRQGGTFLDICPVWVSWTDEESDSLRGVCDIRPNLDVAHECCVHMFSTTLLVEQGPKGMGYAVLGGRVLQIGVSNIDTDFREAVPK